MRYLITLTMGTEYNRYSERIDASTLALALDYVRTEILRKLGGYTEVYSTGGWVNSETDEIAEERGRQFQALTNEIDSLMEVDKLARSLASYAASALNQASVMYTFTPVTAGFVGPNEA